MNKIEIDDGSVRCVFNGTNPMKFSVRFSVLGNNNVLYFLKEHFLFVFFLYLPAVWSAAPFVVNLIV